MKAVLQRVTGACVRVEGKTVGQCGKGLLILLGVADGDGPNEAEMLATKIAALRIFSDDQGKMNKSVKDVGGEILVVSQFTLLANYRCGNRPDYKMSAPPAIANELYEYFSECLRKMGFKVENGIFGADMQISLENDGPVTIVMYTDVLKQPRNGK